MVNWLDVHYNVVHFKYYSNIEYTLIDVQNVSQWKKLTTLQMISKINVTFVKLYFTNKYVHHVNKFQVSHRKKVL